MSKVTRYVNTTAMMESVAEKQMVGKAEVVSIINQFFESLIEELRQGNSIRFEKLGTFSPILTEKAAEETSDSGRMRSTDVIFRSNKACRTKLASDAAPVKHSR